MTADYVIREGTDINKVRNLSYLVRLMGALGAMEAGYRWYRSFNRNRSSIANADRLMAAISTAGWAGETIHLLKVGAGLVKDYDGVRVEPPYLQRGMLIGNEPVLKIWDDCMCEKPPTEIGWLRTIRDKCFAHWDKEVATRFISNIPEGYSDPIMIETPTDENQTERCYPFAIAALTTYVFDTTSPEEMKERNCVKRLGEAIGKVIALAHTLLRQILKESGLELNRIENP